MSSFLSIFSKQHNNTLQSLDSLSLWKTKVQIQAYFAASSYVVSLTSSGRLRLPANVGSPASMPAISGPSGGSSSLPVSYLEYSNANGILAIVGTVTALALATVLLRIYVRAVALKVFGVDDWLMVVTMVSRVQA